MITSRPGTQFIRKRAIDMSVALISTLVLVSGAAFGATIKQTDCEAFAKAAEPHESPLDELSVSPIDHDPLERSSSLGPIELAPIEQSAIDEAAADTGYSVLRSLIAESADIESATPFLYLTPRVASALRDIFETVRGTADEPVAGNIVSSPVADTDKHLDEDLLDMEAVPFSVIDREIDLPPLQRQMFRTDI